jgi:hypothetical protein
MVNAMDAVNNRFGDFTVTFASLMDTERRVVMLSLQHGDLTG